MARVAELVEDVSHSTLDRELHLALNGLRDHSESALLSSQTRVTCKELGVGTSTWITCTPDTLNTRLHGMPQHTGNVLHPGLEGQDRRITTISNSTVTSRDNIGCAAKPRTHCHE